MLVNQLAEEEDEDLVSHFIKKHETLTQRCSIVGQCRRRWTSIKTMLVHVGQKNKTGYWIR